MSSNHPHTSTHSTHAHSPRNTHAHTPTFVDSALTHFLSLTDTRRSSCTRLAPLWLPRLVVTVHRAATATVAAVVTVMMRKRYAYTPTACTHMRTRHNTRTHDTTHA